MTQPDYDAFFRNYIEVFNRSVNGAIDVDAIRNSYAEYMVSASTGEAVMGGANDEKYAAVLEQGAGFYKAVGLKAMTYRKVEATPIDDGHDMVRCYYTADYARKDGTAVTIDFDVVYMLQRRASGPKIFAFVTGDEMGLYRKHGLVDAEGKPT